MSFYTALYEGDGIIHYAPRARAAIQGTKGTRRVARPHARRTHRGAIVALVGAIWNALRSAVVWIDEKFREAHYRRIESYLAQSTDHADLERRLRDLERGNRLNWTDCGSR